MDESVNFYLAAGSALLVAVGCGAGALVYLRHQRADSNVSANAETGSTVDQSVNIRNS